MATGRVGSLTKQCDRLLRDPSIPVPVKRWALSTLDELSGDRQRILRDGGYEDFVLEHIQREADRFKSDDRSGPLCSCRDTECPLKQQTLPAELRTAGSIAAGIREFRQQHRGNPHVLGEAQRSWSDLVGAVEQDLRRIMLHLSDETIPRDERTSPELSDAAVRSNSGP